MEIIFLGTGSNNPTPDRNVSCACLRFDGEVWLFDCGEATQIQLMKSTLKPGKITKIFLTHLHGDHIFGLPGLLCTISQNVKEDKTPIEIYGPVGTRRFIRVTLELSRSLVTFKYIVHELVPVDEQTPYDIKQWRIVESDDSVLHPGEILGKQLHINENGYWSLLENDKISVKSSWIKHRIPSFGFVIEKKNQFGKLNLDKLKERGVPAGPLYAKIKAGQVVELQNGEKINPSDFVDPPLPGKKITILGDCDEVSPDLINLAQGSDVLVHEATLENAFVQKALSRGHSTPNIAASVANRINAKCLLLNHFSQRYKPTNQDPADTGSVCKKLKTSNDSADGDCDQEGVEDDTVQKLIDEARQAFKGDVHAAYDFWFYKI